MVMLTQEKELVKSKRMLDAVGDRLRNYTCADPLMDTTEKTVRTFQWEGREVSLQSYNPSTYLFVHN